MVRRYGQLLVGLALYGATLALMVRAGLGLSPWDVLHQGIANHTGLRIGTVVVIAAVFVLLAWIPLRERPGPGTVANALLVGVFMNLTLDVLPEAHGWPARVGFLVAGLVGNAVATALYIGARLGSGPRDGLMTGLHRVTGRSVRFCRTLVEVVVLAVGIALGGRFGVGTIAYAFGIGPMVHVLMPLLRIKERPHDAEQLAE